MEDKNVTNRIVSQKEWLKERRSLLRDEKDFMRLKDALAERRRALPWIKLEKSYTFQTDRGPETLRDLFAGKSQLIVYHFMFGPDWEEGCIGCTEVADNFNGTIEYLRVRDANMIAVSRGPLDRLKAYQQRMGWTFDWVSSADSDFNFDFNASFREAGKSPKIFNFRNVEVELEETHGVSVFVEEDDQIFHTYSCYARSVDLMCANMQYMDLLPKGRQDHLGKDRIR